MFLLLKRLVLFDECLFSYVFLSHLVINNFSNYLRIRVCCCVHVDCVFVTTLVRPSFTCAEYVKFVGSLMTTLWII